MSIKEAEIRSTKKIAIRMINKGFTHEEVERALSKTIVFIKEPLIPRYTNCLIFEGNKYVWLWI